METESLMTMRPLVSKIVPPRPDENVIKSVPELLLALMTAARSEPGPESFRLVTANDAGVRRVSNCVRRRRVAGRRSGVLGIRRRNVRRVMAGFLGTARDF